MFWLNRFDNRKELSTFVNNQVKRVSGITAIKVRKTKSEVELSLEEAHAGKVTQWDSVDDYINALLSK